MTTSSDPTETARIGWQRPITDDTLEMLTMATATAMAARNTLRHVLELCETDRPAAARIWLIRDACITHLRSAGLETAAAAYAEGPEANPQRSEGAAAHNPDGAA